MWYFSTESCAFADDNNDGIKEVFNITVEMVEKINFS